VGFENKSPLGAVGRMPPSLTPGTLGIGRKASRGLHSREERAPPELPTPGKA